MAHLIRHLIFGSVATVALLVAPRGLAQDTSTPPATFKTLLVTETSGVLTGLFYDHEGRQTRLSVSSERLSPAYPAPAGGVISVYREVIAPGEGKPRRIPVVDIQLGAHPRSLLLLSSTPTPDGAFPGLQGQVLDSSFDAHPRDAIRIFNFSPSRLALRAGDSSPFEMSPGQQKVVPYPPANAELPALWLQAAMLKDNQWSVEISRPQSIIQGNTRAIWILRETQGSLDRPGPTLALRSLVESVPAPTP